MVHYDLPRFVIHNMSYLKIQVSNTHGISEEIQVGVCHPNSSAFSTLEVKLQDELITVTSDNVSTTLPATITNELFTVSIGNAPGKPTCNVVMSNNN